MFHHTYTQEAHTIIAGDGFFSISFSDFAKP